MLHRILRKSRERERLHVDMWMRFCVGVINSHNVDLLVSFILISTHICVKALHVFVQKLIKKKKNSVIKCLFFSIYIYIRYIRRFTKSVFTRNGITHYCHQSRSYWLLKNSITYTVFWISDFGFLKYYSTSNKWI